VKSIIPFIAFLFVVIFSNAQTKLTEENIQKDSIIKADIIDPAERDANGEAPDWKTLIAEIARKYDATYADRTVTKAIIYFTFGKDWSAFTSAIVKYTEKYEHHENLKLLNKNAGFILKYSNDKKELETALGWSRHTIDKEPANEEYKKTYDALQTKLSSK
jgi:hypothetical protein